MQVLAPEVGVFLLSPPAPPPLRPSLPLLGRGSVLLCLLSLRSVHSTEQSSPVHSHCLGEDGTSLLFLPCLTTCSSSLCAGRLVLLKGKDTGTLSYLRPFNSCLMLWTQPTEPHMTVLSLSASFSFLSHSILAITPLFFCFIIFINLLFIYLFTLGGISLCGPGYRLMMLLPQAPRNWDCRYVLTFSVLYCSSDSGLSEDSSLYKTLAHPLFPGQHPLIH